MPLSSECKLYTDTVQTIPSKKWTTIGFDVALANDHDMFNGTGDVSDPSSALVVPHGTGRAMWFSKVHWESITVPQGDTRVRQYIEQFCRDPFSEPNGFPDEDSTGSNDSNDTTGREFNNNAWAFTAFEGEPVGLRVWHDHHEPVKVTHAQFVMLTWDF